MATLFERLQEKQPQPPEKERPVKPEIQSGPLLRWVVPPAEPKSPPIEKLLDWLLNHWTEDTISVRDIHRSGPNVTRNRKSATELAERLVKKRMARAHQVAQAR
jgi:hypothetical protein